MKKFIFSFALLGLFSLEVAAQSNNAITVFTEGGERFYLILNGVRQNSTPETNVRATGLNAQQYKAKVIFDQKGIADCDKSIPMMWAAEPVSNTEFTFSVKKDKKGKYKWQFVSQAPLAANTNQVSSTTTPLTTNTVAVQNTNQNNVNNQTVNANVNTNTVTTVSSTTTTSGNAGVNGSGANINIGINGTGLTMNMNVNDGMNTSGTTTTTTTTSSYTTSTTTNGVTTTNTGNSSQSNTGNPGNVGISMNVNGLNGTTNSTTTSTSSSVVNTGSNVSNNATTAANCSVPMSATDYADAKKSITAKPFEDTKKTIAMQVADNNCLSVDQIKGIMGLFSFEDTKLEYAKYCYARCTEKKNYYKVNDAFTFDASSQELNDFIQGK